MSGLDERLIEELQTAARIPPSSGFWPDIERRVRRRSRRRRVVLSGVVTAAVALTAGLAILLSGATQRPPVPVIGEDIAPPIPSNVFPVPQRGEAHPAYLTDGTPVYVVHQETGDVDVLSAVDTHVVGFRKALWWCAAAGVFHEPRHGATYSSRGAALVGPAVSDLPRFEVAIRGPSVIVGSPLAPAGRGTDSLDDPDGMGPAPCFDLVDRGHFPWVAHPPLPTTDLAEALANSDGTYLAVDASLRSQRQQVALCDRLRTLAEACPDGSPVLPYPTAGPWAEDAVVLIRGWEGDLSEAIVMTGVPG